MPPALAMLKTVPKSSTIRGLPRSPFPIVNRSRKAGAIANSAWPPTLLQSAIFPLPSSNLKKIMTFNNF
jgi:hypothetical protein